MEQQNVQLKRILEAALFMAPGAVSVEELAKIAQSTVPEVRVALNELVHEFESAHTSLKIEETETGFMMKVKPEYEAKVSHLAASPEMNKAVLKTLAFVAYKQPVKQSEVIKFRNTKAYEHIGLLMEKGFIRRERSGLTYMIFTTKKFAEYFGTTMKRPEEIDENVPD